MRVHLRRLRALRDLLGLETADVVASCAIRRAADKLGKALDVPDIIVPGLGAEVTVRHVLQQAAAKIADGLVAHRGLLSEVRNTSILSPKREPCYPISA